MLTQIRVMNLKKPRNGNTRYARCKLEDFTGSVECVVWSDEFSRFKDELQEDRICFVRAAVERNFREEPSLIITRILSLEQAQRELTTGLLLSLRLDLQAPQVIDSLAAILQRTPGNCPVFLAIADAAGKRTLLKTGERFRINPAKVSASDLEMLLGQGNVKFSGPMNGNGRNGK
jgi:DNA polymerase-3 subunit alpha